MWHRVMAQYMVTVQSPWAKEVSACDVNVLTDGMLLGMVGKRRYQSKPLVALVRLSTGHTSWCYEVVLCYEYVLVRNN